MSIKRNWSLTWVLDCFPLKRDRDRIRVFSVIHPLYSLKITLNISFVRIRIGVLDSLSNDSLLNDEHLSTFEQLGQELLYKIDFILIHFLVN